MAETPVSAQHAPAAPAAPSWRGPARNRPSPSRPAAPLLGRPDALALAAPLTVTEVCTLEGFEALAPEWDALVRRTDDQAFHRHDYLLLWLRHFAPGVRLRVLTAREPGGRLVAALALREERVRQYGLRVRQLSSVSNAHSGRFDMLAEQPRAAAEAFLAHLARDAHWDVLRVTHLSEGGAGWALQGAARERGLREGVWHSGASPYVVLPDTLEAWAAHKRSNRKPLRRKRRRLEERGRVEVERVTGGEALEARLEEAFALERRGWKARNGTAITQDPRTHGFYRQLAAHAARGGELALYVLRLDGNAIAFQYGLQVGARYLAMKPGYDEAYADVSPGQLLTESVIEDLIPRGVRELDLLGDESAAKREWTDRTRRHGWLFVFRGSPMGRMLHVAKFRWAPLAKRTVKRLREAKARGVKLGEARLQGVKLQGVKLQGMKLRGRRTPTLH